MSILLLFYLQRVELNYNPDFCIFPTLQSPFLAQKARYSKWPFDNAPAFDKHLVRAQYTMESLSSFCGIFLVVSGLLKLIFLKFIGHSMVDSIQISSVKISILGLQSLGSHGESTETHRYLIRVSQGT